jgi:hypothetical protein
MSDVTSQFVFPETLRHKQTGVLVVFACCTFKNDKRNYRSGAGIINNQSQLHPLNTIDSLTYRLLSSLPIFVIHIVSIMSLKRINKVRERRLILLVAGWTILLRWAIDVNDIIFSCLHRLW